MAITPDILAPSIAYARLSLKEHWAIVRKLLCRLRAKEVWGHEYGEVDFSRWCTALLERKWGFCTPLRGTRTSEGRQPTGVVGSRAKAGRVPASEVALSGAWLLTLLPEGEIPAGTML